MDKFEKILDMIDHQEKYYCRMMNAASSTRR